MRRGQEVAAHGSWVSRDSLGEWGVALDSHSHDFVGGQRATREHSSMTTRPENGVRPLPEARRGGDWLWSAVIGLFAATIMAVPIPAGNEPIYMPLLQKRADPTYLSTDWTFGSGFAEHAVFDFVFAPLVNLVGLEPVAWAGRLLSWVIIARLVIAIGRRLGAPPWTAAIAVGVYLGIRQSMGVGAESIFSLFEAKSVAWPLLLGAILAAMDRRIELAAVLAGLTFAFHSAIGLWGGGALVLAMLISSETRRQTFRWLPATILIGLIGAIPVVTGLLDSSMGAGNAEFLVLTRLPHHLDPFSFGQRGPLILAIMLTFNLGWAYRHRSEFVPRLLGVIQSSLAVVMVLGVIARMAGWYEFLLLRPFRVLPVLVPLLFLLTVAGMLVRGFTAPRRPLLADKGTAVLLGIGVIGLLSIAVLWNPVPRWINDARANLNAWQAPPTDLELAFDWLSSDTDPSAVVASPPWEDRMFYLSERAQFVSWGAVTYDRVQDWRDRLERSMTDIAPLYGDADLEEALARYEEVPYDAWLEAAQIHGLTHLLTTAEYETTPLHSVGDWHVYDIAAG